MTRISRFQLKENRLGKIFDLFIKVISRSNNEKNLDQTLSYLLSPVEKIMIAKRITIMFLLLKHINQRQIALSLKVSTATVSRYAILLGERNNALINILKAIIGKEKRKIFLLISLKIFLFNQG